MSPFFTVWLVVIIYQPGQPLVLVTDQKMESIDACLLNALQILKGATAIKADDGFELQVRCSIQKQPETPAGAQ